MNSTVATTAFARLFGVTPKTIADLAKRDIIVSAGKRGRWLLQPSVSGYVRPAFAMRRQGTAARLGRSQENVWALRKRPWPR